MHVRNHLSFLYAALRHSTLRQHLQPSKANPARADQRGAQRARSDASCELARHARAARATRGSAYSALLRLASHTAHMRLGESRSAVCSAGWPSHMDCPPVVLAGMIVRTIVFSRRNPISVILGRGGRARARRSEDQTLPTPFCTARAAPEYPVLSSHEPRAIRGSTSSITGRVRYGHLCRAGVHPHQAEARRGVAARVRTGQQ